MFKGRRVCMHSLSFVNKKEKDGLKERTPQNWLNLFFRVFIT